MSKVPSPCDAGHVGPFEDREHAEGTIDLLCHACGRIAQEGHAFRTVAGLRVEVCRQIRPVATRPCATRPAWWTAADDEAVARFIEWRSTDWYPHTVKGDQLPPHPDDQAALDAFCDAHLDKWTCRRCRHWHSADGAMGDCRGPEVACGTTRAVDMCEQFDIPEVQP
jgi:hypothetical protein